MTKRHARQFIIFSNKHKMQQLDRRSEHRKSLGMTSNTVELFGNCRKCKLVLTNMVE